ncbi:MAG: PQQ-dependent sugar dehydrogenase [Desulfobulbaceae bacterium]|nr:PQQ-dependent sugar dehydrogenase [Desulfobulbaceae bacterium]
MKKLLPFILFFLLLLATPPQTPAALIMRTQTLTVNGYTVQLKVPEGMRVDFMAPLNGPRFLTRGPGDELLVGSRGADIFRLKWPYTVPETLVTLTGRNHSVAYRNNQIFIAETGGLYSAPYSGPTDTLQADDFSLVATLPSETGGHWSRTVIVGPDQQLYIGLGISGNCSDEYLDNSYPFEKRRGGVFLLDESGAAPVLTPYSSGLRNPIGLAFQPGSGILYATNAGPDNLGFDQPPEIFVPLGRGSFHGMPWFQYYNGAFRSGECATSTPPRPASEATPPPVTFDARSTPQGIAFVTHPALGPEFTGNALVAIHGSWAVPPGGDTGSRRPPKIVMVRFSDNAPTSVTDIVTGFQRADGTRFARPSGMVMGADGSLYFTSDGGEVTGLFRLTSSSKSVISGTTTSSVSFLLLKKKTLP